MKRLAASFAAAMMASAVAPAAVQVASAGASQPSSGSKGALLGALGTPALVAASDASASLPRPLTPQSNSTRTVLFDDTGGNNYSGSVSYLFSQASFNTVLNAAGIDRTDEFTVKLMSDVVVKGPIAINNRHVTLDLNGHNIVVAISALPESLFPKDKGLFNITDSYFAITNSDTSGQGSIRYTTSDVSTFAKVAEHPLILSTSSSGMYSSNTISLTGSAVAPLVITSDSKSPLVKTDGPVVVDHARLTSYGTVVDLEVPNAELDRAANLSITNSTLSSALIDVDPVAGASEVAYAPQVSSVIFESAGKLSLADSAIRTGFDGTALLCGEHMQGSVEIKSTGTTSVATSQGYSSLNSEQLRAVQNAADATAGPVLAYYVDDDGMGCVSSISVSGGGTFDFATKESKSYDVSTVTDTTLLSALGGGVGLNFQGESSCKLDVLGGTFSSDWGKGAYIVNGQVTISGGMFRSLDKTTLSSSYVTAASSAAAFDETTYTAQKASASDEDVYLYDAMLEAKSAEKGIIDAYTNAKGDESHGVFVDAAHGANVSIVSGWFGGEKAFWANWGTVADGEFAKIAITHQTSLEDAVFFGRVGTATLTDADFRKYFSIKAGIFAFATTDTESPRMIAPNKLYHGYSATETIRKDGLKYSTVHPDPANSVAIINRNGVDEYFMYLYEVFEEVRPGETIKLTQDVPKRESLPDNVAADTSYTPAVLDFTKAETDGKAPVTLDLNGHKIDVEPQIIWRQSSYNGQDFDNTLALGYSATRVKTYITVKGHASLKLKDSATGGMGGIVVRNHACVPSNPDATKLRAVIGISVEGDATLELGGVPITHKGGDESDNSLPVTHETESAGACLRVDDANFTLKDGDKLEVEGETNYAPALYIHNQDNGKEVRIEPGSTIQTKSIYAPALVHHSGMLHVLDDQVGVSPACIEGVSFAARFETNANAIVDGGYFQANSALTAKGNLYPRMEITSADKLDPAVPTTVYPDMTNPEGGAADGKVDTEDLKAWLKEAPTRSVSVVFTDRGGKTHTMNLISSVNVDNYDFTFWVPTVDEDKKTWARINSIRWNGTGSSAPTYEESAKKELTVVNTVSIPSAVAPATLDDAHIKSYLSANPSAFPIYFSYRDEVGVYKQFAINNATEADNFIFTVADRNTVTSSPLTTVTYDLTKPESDAPTYDWTQPEPRPGVALYVEENGTANVQIRAGAFQGTGAVTLGTHTSANVGTDSDKWTTHVEIGRDASKTPRFYGPVQRSTDSDVYATNWSQGITSDRGIRIYNAEFYTADTTESYKRGLEPDQAYMEAYVTIDKPTSGTPAVVNDLAGPYIAKYNAAGSVAYYNKTVFTSVSDAVAAALADLTSGQKKIELINDGTGALAVDTPIPVGMAASGAPGDILIDLSGFKLDVDAGGGFAVDSGATLTFTDSSISSGEVRVNGTTFVSAQGTGSTVNVESGKVTTTGAAAIGFEAKPGASVYLKDGTFSATAGSTMLRTTGGVGAIIGGTYQTASADTGTIVRNGEPRSATPKQTFSGMVGDANGDSVINRADLVDSLVPVTLTGGEKINLHTDGYDIQVNGAGDLMVYETDKTSRAVITGGTITANASNPPIVSDGGRLSITVPLSGASSTVNILAAHTAVQVNGGSAYVGEYADNLVPNNTLVTIASQGSEPTIQVTDAQGVPVVELQSGSISNSTNGKAVETVGIQPEAKGVPTVVTVGKPGRTADKAIDLKSPPIVNGTYVGQPSGAVTEETGQSIRILSGSLTNAGDTANQFADPSVYIIKGIMGTTPAPDPVIRDIIRPKDGATILTWNGDESRHGYSGSAISITDDDLNIYGTINNEHKVKVSDGDLEIQYLSPERTVAGAVVNFKLVGHNAYKGEITGSFKIEPVRLDTPGKTAKITYKNPFQDTDKYEYESAGVTPQIEVTFDGKTLTKDVDYTVLYSNNKKASTTSSRAQVRVTGKGNYQGDVTSTFVIVPRSINKATVEPIPVQGFTNKTVRYVPTVKDGTKTLVSDTDFVLSWSDNINEGTAKVTITGTGNYDGTRTETFTISKTISDYAQIPDVTGKSMADAKKALEDAGFTVDSKIVDDASETVDTGLATKTDPAKGEWVLKKAKVTLYKSIGTPSNVDITIPDVTGWESTTAEAQLQKLGFTVSTSLVSSDDVAAGQVIKIDPSVKAKKGTTITMTVSSGSSKIKMPAVENSWETSALGILEGNMYQFKVSVVREKSSTVKSGRVIRQSPAPNTLINMGAPVTIVVSSGEEDVPESPTSPSTPSTTAVPSTPATSANPSTPATSDVPATSASPSTPATAATPSTPATSEDPSTPATQVEPGVVNKPVVSGDTGRAEVETRADGSVTVRLTNEDGTAAEGWVTAGGERYYASGGVAVTGKREIDGETFVFNPTGEVGTGWTYLPSTDTWYYAVTRDESAQTGATVGAVKKDSWVCDAGVWYATDANGAMRTGWVRDPWGSGSWYYFNPSSTVGTRGAMLTGWFHDGFDWYYASDGGVIQAGWVWDGSAWYYLRETESGYGSLCTGWFWDGGAWYYSDVAGVMQTGWQYMDSSWYLLNPQSDSGIGQGVMRTGWVWYNGAWYYFNPDGTMLRSAWTPDGYWVNADGIGVW